MRKAERLFEIIQLLRGAVQPMTAAQIAERLEVNVRTLYRDIAALQAQRVPIEGAPGLGYVLRRGYDLPPLMFTQEEVDAIAIGAYLVRRTGDESLRIAAQGVLSKLASIVSDDQQRRLATPQFYVSDAGARSSPAVDLSQVREAIRAHAKLAIEYEDESGSKTQRTIWPIAVVYYVEATLIAAWCELREDFRHFRTDRVASLVVTKDSFPDERDALLHAWLERSSFNRGSRTQSPLHRIG
ncbi:helix-turn-helix transcriptional regulator [Diaphorobacter aerolatus]|uniref:YafY family transcriptional regulator n=1 Tax=Diaphorobacter aerolatus TaxID=1288495 RepID=A0A7H0GKD3_9BURK|nr:YafY family protein [Diaphorobacter aerolatus]QNP48749.1 YafY family transcriptional regulator [Diaphorobacter aerolatus]